MRKKTIEEITTEINVLKKDLAVMWESKGRTDRDILILAGMIDRLLNQHDRLLMKTASKK